jgi:hypothetical protein
MSTSKRWGSVVSGQPKPVVAWGFTRAPLFLATFTDPPHRQRHPISVSLGSLEEGVFDTEQDIGCGIVERFASRVNKAAEVGGLDGGADPETGRDG